MKFLVIYNWEGESVRRFPLNHITYEVIGDKLHVEYYDTLHTFRLDRYDFAVEESQRGRGRGNRHI